MVYNIKFRKNLLSGWSKKKVKSKKEGDFTMTKQEKIERFRKMNETAEKGQTAGG